MAKPVFTPEARRAFLSNSAQIWCAERRGAAKFFKFPLVSKNNLRSTQVYASYRYHVFMLDEDVYVGVEHNRHSNEMPSHCKMPLESACRLFKFLNPAMVSIYVDAMDAELQRNITTLLNFASGKIAFTFRMHVGKTNQSEIIKEFASRVMELKCDPEVLAVPEMPILKLDYLNAGGIGRMNSLDSIMQHEIKHLEFQHVYALDIDGWPEPQNEEGHVEAEPSSDNTSPIQQCATIKRVSVRCTFGDYSVIREVVDGIILRCPNLEKLDLRMLSEEADISEYTADDLHSLVLDTYGFLKRFKDDYYQNIAKITVVCGRGFEFASGVQPDDVWMTMLAEDESLQGVRFRRSAEEFNYSLRIIEEDEFFSLVLNAKAYHKSLADDADDLLNSDTN